MGEDGVTVMVANRSLLLSFSFLSCLVVFYFFPPITFTQTHIHTQISLKHLLPLSFPTPFIYPSFVHPSCAVVFVMVQCYFLPYSSCVCCCELSGGGMERDLELLRGRRRHCGLAAAAVAAAAGCGAAAECVFVRRERPAVM